MRDWEEQVEKARILAFWQEVSKPSCADILSNGPLDKALAISSSFQYFLKTAQVNDMRILARSSRIKKFWATIGLPELIRRVRPASARRRGPPCSRCRRR